MISSDEFRPVRVNPVVSVTIPDSVYMAPPGGAPITVASQEVAPGVYYLTGIY